MCGIIGYTGNRSAAPVILDGLKALEYRGYDSAGLALLSKDDFVMYKRSGRVEALKGMLNKSSETFCTGIGHTRWATHGKPTDINSHPHKSGRVVLVHNGIINNYKELLKELKEIGKSPISDTDSEVAAMLIDSLYKGDPINAITEAIPRLDGSYALGIIFTDIPDKIYAVRKDSPLIIGVCENECYLSSDLPPTPVHYICEDNEVAELHKGCVRFFKGGVPIKKEGVAAKERSFNSSLGDFSHYMIKEIHEQPKAITDTVNSILKDGKLFGDCSYDFKPKGRIHIVACGSAMHAGLYGKYVIEKLARVPVNVELASEFRYSDPILSEGDVVIAISQSGETADTLAAVRLANSRGIKTLAIVNVQDSAIAREAKHVIYTVAGREVCVATTKAYTCQCAVMFAIALKIGESQLGTAEVSRLTGALSSLASEMKSALGLYDACHKVAKRISDAESVFFIGRGRDKAACDEGSLKLKEVSYIHSECYAAGELKHGTISLITDGVPVIALITDNEVAKKTIANLEETVARGAVPFVIAKNGVSVSGFDTLGFDAECEYLSPIVAAVPLQFIAYSCALLLGRDIDKPRNLAKSVTVE